MVVLAASCKDPEPSIQQLMTDPADGWVFHSVIAFNPSTGAQEDLVRNPDVFPECQLDNAIFFMTDGTFTIHNNNKCDPDDPEISDNGTWALSDDNSKLTMVSALSAGVLVELDALSVTETRIKGETSKLGDITTAAIVTFRKKGTF
jgi:hypothetical protein